MRDPEEPTVPPVFRVTADGGAGLTRGQSRRSIYTRPSRGVRRLASTTDSRHLDIVTASAACVDDAVVTDLAAAGVWRLPLPWDLQAVGTAVSMSVAPGAARPKRAGVRGRRLDIPAFHLTEKDGLRVTTPARTWLDCAAFISYLDVVAMGDAILHRGLASEGELTHLLTWGYRRRGVAKIRRAVPILDGRAESPGESWVRALLLEARLPAPECNVDVFEGGVWLARVDMRWRRQRVIVEYDGAVHRDERQRRRDAERLNALQAAGWLVIVLTADDLRRTRQTVALIRSALSQSR